MFTKIQDKLDGICIAAKNRLHRFAEQTEGMETLQVIIIIAVALGVAGVIITVVRGIQQNAQSQIDNFNQTFSQGG